MRALLLVIFLTLMAYAAGFLLFLGTLPRAPADPHADAIVALTGGGMRLDTAVSLLERGIGQRLLISGVDMETRKETLGHMAEGGQRFSCCADIGYAAEDTRGNAQEAAEWARQHHFKSLVIVTARYHMPRALREFSAAMPQADLIAYPVENGSVVVDDWWHHPKTTMLLQREYVKYIASLAMTSLARPA